MVYCASICRPCGYGTMHQPSRPNGAATRRVLYVSLNTPARLATAIGVGALLLAAPAAAHAAAPPTPENSVGILTLLDTGGKVVAVGSTTAQPGFATVLAPAPCPAGFTDAARASVVPAGGKAMVISATIPLTNPAAPAAVPVLAVLDDYKLGSGATVALECLSVKGGIPVPAASVFSVGLDIAGTGYTVVPAPVLPSNPPTTAPGTTGPTTSPPTASATAPQSVPATAGAETAPGSQAASGSGRGDLASTGSATLPLLFGAGILSAAGAALLLRRRSKASHS